MNNEEQILAVLQKLLATQEQTLAVHKQAIENQQKAIDAQQLAIRNQVATGRLYRIALAVLAVFLLVFFYYLFSVWHGR